MTNDIRLEKLRQEKIKLMEVIDLSSEDREKLSSIINKEEALNLVIKNGAFLSCLSLDFKEDNDIVVAAIKNYSHAFSYASDKLKNNREIVLLALEADGENLKYVSPELKQDKTILLKALEQNLEALTSFPEDVKEQIDVNNPIKSLQALILNEKLEEKIPNKTLKVSQHKI